MLPVPAVAVDVLAPGVVLTVDPGVVVAPGVAVMVPSVPPVTEPLGVEVVPPTVEVAPVVLGVVAAPVPVAVVAAPVPVAVVAAPVPVAVVLTPALGATGHGPVVVPVVEEPMRRGHSDREQQGDAKDH